MLDPSSTRFTLYVPVSNKKVKYLPCVKLKTKLWQGTQYGNTGCGVFKWEVQNSKGYCIRINILKGNYCLLRIGLMGASEVFKNMSFKNQLFSSSHSPNYFNVINDMYIRQHDLKPVY